MNADHHYRGEGLADAVRAYDRAALAAQAQRPRASAAGALTKAGFVPRDNRLKCDECGGLYSRQFLPIHKCDPQP